MPNVNKWQTDQNNAGYKLGYSNVTIRASETARRHHSDVVVRDIITPWCPLDGGTLCKWASQVTGRHDIRSSMTWCTKCQFARWPLDLSLVLTSLSHTSLSTAATECQLRHRWSAVVEVREANNHPLSHAGRCPCHCSPSLFVISFSAPYIFARLKNRDRDLLFISPANLGHHKIAHVYFSKFLERA